MKRINNIRVLLEFLTFNKAHLKYFRIHVNQVANNFVIETHGSSITSRRSKEYNGALSNAGTIYV